MADEQIVTNIVATSDFSGLIADVQKASAALAKFKQQAALTNTALASQANAAQKSFGDTLRATGQFSTHFVTVSDDVQKFGKQLDSGKLKLKDYFKTWQDHTRASGGLIRDLAKQQVALQNAVVQPLGKAADGLMKFNVHVPKGLDAVKNKTQLARMEMQIYNKVVQDGGVQLINWGKNTQWAGRQLTVGLTVPIAGFGMAAAKAFRDVDKELTRLTKVYGDLSKTTGANLDKVRKDVSATAKELSASMGVSFKDTIALAADIAATGKTGNELLGSIQETTRLSVLGEVDRQEAMKATLAIQSAFKQNTEELSQSINFLNAVENQTSTSLADLVEAIPKAGPVVKGLGGDIKDLALYLTAMREGGINATEGANALKSGLASLINPTKVAVGTFKSFGIDLLGIVNNNAGNVTQTLLDLQGALDKLDPLQKQQAIEQLFGKFQFSRMNALFENLGKQGSQTLQVMDLMKASSQDLQRIATGELAQVTESAAGKYSRALETLKANMAEVGDKFLTIGTSIINVVNKVLDFINKMPDPLKNIVTIIGGFTALAGPLIMLTGVFANLFGYIIKGIGHFKALFKGGEGFKLLTPEMVAAQKAGDLIEQTFYSDAEAARALQAALQGVNDQLTILQQKAAGGAISVQPTISTVKGNTIIQGASRVANPQHPLIGEEGTRASAHMNPVSKMNAEEKMRQSIFGMVPNPIPLNRAIGATPQVYMSGDMPLIEGVTSFKGKSTGVVAEEAAKWHAMTAALSMQSKEEIAMLKREVASTGAITTELSTSYQALLPQMTEITSMASQEASMIVADLQAGKIKVEQAQAKIIQLNATVEAMMAETAQSIAISQGRIANVTTVPLTSQPVIDPKTGKSNMKELFHKTGTASLVNKIAGALGVRTSGGGYSIETTKPRRLNSGGAVYRMLGGEEEGHPGYPKGKDTVPAWLTPGEYVVRKEVVDALGPKFFDQINALGDKPQGLEGLGIDKTAPVVGAHASLPSTYAAHEVAAEYTRHLPSSFMPFAENFPDQPVQVLDSQKLGLFREENDALRLGKRGLTRVELLRALAARNKNLFKYLPGLSLNEQKVLKKNLLAITATLDPSKMYHDDTLANIFQKAKTLTFSQLSGIDRDNFQKVMNVAQKPAYIRQIGLENLMSGDESSMGRKEARVLAEGKDKFAFKNLQGKHAIGYRALSGKLFMTESGETRRFKKSIFDDMSLEKNGRTPRLNPNRMPISYDQAAMNYRWRFPNRLGYPVLRRSGGGSVNYLAGGGIAGAFMGGVRNSFGKNLISSGKSFSMPQMSMGAQMGIGMGGMMAGQMMGGPAGMAVMMASNILPMISGLKMVGGFLPTLTKVAGILGRLTIPGAIVGTLFAIGKGLAIWRQNAMDAGEVNRAMMGGTKSALAEVGLSYTSITDRIKDMNKQLELSKAKVANAYESFTGSGVSGLTLTIKQLKEGISDAKKNAKETVGIFNKADDSQVVDLATSMKAQFVAMGMSVEDATNKIYTIISASNKADQAFTAISSKGFKAIIDRSTAAKQSLEILADQLNKPFNFNAEEFKRGLDTVIASYDAYRQSLVGKKVNGQQLDETQALKITLEEIQKIKGATTKLDSESLAALKKQDLVLGSMLGSSESIASVFAKYQLYMSGLSDVMNIGALSPEDAVSAIEGYRAVADAAEDVVGAQTALGKAAKAAQDRADKSAKAAKNAAKQDSASIDDQIKAKQKLIDKLEEERQKRLDILDLQEKSQSFETEIKQAQIRYQQALATGNLAQAAQEKLSIEQLSADRQRELARQSINDKFDAERKKLEAEIERLQNQKDKQAKAIASSQNKAGTDAAVAAEANALEQQLIDVIAKNGGQFTDEVNKQISVIINDAINSKNKELSAAGKSMQQKYRIGSGLKSAPGPMDVNNNAPSYKAIFDSLSSDAITQAKSVDKFAKAVDIFVGKVNPDASQASSSQITVNSSTGPRGSQTYTVGAMQLVNAGQDIRVGKTFIDKNGKKWQIESQNRDVLTVKKAAWNGMRGMAGSMALVGETGPEFIKFGQTADIIPMHKMQMPMYNVASNSLAVANDASNGKMGGITIINQISGADMNMEQLSEVVVRKTIGAMKNIKDVNFAAQGKPGVKRI